VRLCRAGRLGTLQNAAEVAIDQALETLLTKKRTITPHETVEATPPCGDTQTPARTIAAQGTKAPAAAAA